jgi:hypothetical protein
MELFFHQCQSREMLQEDKRLEWLECDTWHEISCSKKKPKQSSNLDSQAHGNFNLV